ncbi:Carbamoylphosphate synthase large subunit [Methanobrevibacter gottschalkii]|uniref:Carbamoylphosphate synthase large subunit n=1 Tax=Methanobrevibacter gottschalkii TaxID=190974 RepID=A0A1H7NF06_9EURY|nr:ATP-grasp domain-containing protein [Methanobrevibacter gottschalkii]SEL22090.1 Carbamoylphosphate synthase large subunit [Methanobrevibacter gottschalkii]
MKNVLVFPCGSEIGLEIHNALKYSKDFRLFGGSSVNDHGKFVYKNYIPNIPFIDDENLCDFLNEIIEKYDIDLIYPSHDDVVLKFSEIKDKLKTHVVVSNDKTCDICRSKSKTYNFFKNYNFVPKIYEISKESFDNDEMEKNVEAITYGEFPIFLKPDIGQGAKGVAIANNVDDLKHHFKENSSLIAVEYLPNEEYTIDCFSSKGKLLYCEKRERIRIKDGISVNSITVKTEDKIKEIAKIINSKLVFDGAWFFQLKKDKNDDYKLLEIAPRIAGTMALHRNTGVNFPLLTLYSHLGFDLSIISNKNKLTIDRALTNRFGYEIDYQRVYLDFDDTVFIKGKVNTYLMMFLYQCVNENKEIILITKHEKDINKTLKDLKIDLNLFNEIISLTKKEEKYKYIDKNVSSIFIDDSFSERLSISNKFNIPVFDLDAIESLINWRM